MKSPRLPGLRTSFTAHALFLPGSLALIAWICGGALLQAQVVNSWINPASGAWEDAANWSLGSRPAASERVAITNAGYKGVGISGATVSGSPDSMTVNDLSISAPGSALSALILNYAGTERPLHVLNSGEIGANGSLQNFYSSLQVDGSTGGSFQITEGGQLIQEGGLTVITPSVQFRNGMLNATNATMNLGLLQLGYSAYPQYGMVNQSGGVILSSGVSIDRGTYSLSENGILYALGGTSLNGAEANFIQSSGSNYGDAFINDGKYRMWGGLLHGNLLITSGDLGLVQTGGGVEFGDVQVRGGQGYRLQAGALSGGTLTLGTNATFLQDGGTCILSNALNLQGDTRTVYPYWTVTLDRYGGDFFAPAVAVARNAQIQQHGGNLQVSGPIMLSGGVMFLNGGVVSSAGMGVGSDSTVVQDDGTNQVNGVLSITGTYRLEGGRVSVNGIYLRGYFPIYWSGGLVNSGVINFGGRLDVSLSQNSVGSLQLGETGHIGLGPELSLRFADSSALNWNTNAQLVIDSWNWGATHHVYFGNSSSGLTPTQLACVRFFTPHNLPEGYYPARILSTGEIVPAPVLVSSRSGGTNSNQLTLSWSDGYQLLSAPNVNGPYQPVSGATSPYTVNTTAAPRQFYKLADQ